MKLWDPGMFLLSLAGRSKNPGKRKEKVSFTGRDAFRKRRTRTIRRSLSRRIPGTNDCQRSLKNWETLTNTHKRISDMIINEAYEEKALRDEMKREAEDEKNLDLWQEVRDNNPGMYCVVELIPLNENGLEVFDIDLAGVDRTISYISHQFLA